MTRKTFALIACCLISPAIAAAQTGGLTRVQLLALQQELKDQCGLAHSTGVMDGPTRHAIAVCNKKYGTQGNGAALLTAMNVGFNSGEMAPQGMGGMMGNDHDMMSGDDSAMHSKMMKDKMMKDKMMKDKMMKEKMMNGMQGTKGMKTRTRKAGTGTNRGDMDSDAGKKGVDATSGGVDVDGRTDDRKMAHDSAMAGRMDGRVRNPGMGKRTKAGKDSISH